MSGQLILFGATGYTGRLTASAMVRRGLRPVLAGRRADALAALAAERGGLDVAFADAARPETVRALLRRGDVLVSTVGPFLRWGDAALAAAIDARAHYIDLAGEPPFVRRVFERQDRRARAASCLLLTAMAYDSVPGNLAGALALRDAGAAATAVRIGYFDDAGLRGMSGGTRASNLAGALEPGFARRGGRIVTERAAARLGSFVVQGTRLRGVSVGTSEAFTLPRIHPGLRDVDVYLGWFGIGRASRILQLTAPLAAAASPIPGVRSGLRALAYRYAHQSGRGPDERARAATRSLFVAEATGASGEPLATAHLAGINGYEFSANLLAWVAEQVAVGKTNGIGALGPVEVFGLDRLEAAVAECGIQRVRADQASTTEGNR
jgi:short subunit dehydrogenase-like uncharacterized protein